MNTKTVTWIPCSERLPPNKETEYLVWLPAYSDQGYNVIARWTGLSWSLEGGYIGEDEITHWMEMIPGPDEAIEKTALADSIPLEDIAARTVASLVQAGAKEAWRAALKSYADTKRREAAKEAERAKIDRLPRESD